MTTRVDAIRKLFSLLTTEKLVEIYLLMPEGFEKELLQEYLTGFTRNSGF